MTGHWRCFLHLRPVEPTEQRRPASTQSRSSLKFATSSLGHFTTIPTPPNNERPLLRIHGPKLPVWSRPEAARAGKRRKSAVQVWLSTTQWLTLPPNRSQPELSLQSRMRDDRSKQPFLNGCNSLDNTLDRSNVASGTPRSPRRPGSVTYAAASDEVARAAALYGVLVLWSNHIRSGGTS